jgi:hypothetical protein
MATLRIDCEIDSHDLQTSWIISELKRRGIKQDDLPKSIEIKNLNDELIYDFIVKNWDKITLEKLENCIK